MVNLLLAAFLVAHGLIHGLFLAPRPAPTAGAPPWPFDRTDSWLVSRMRFDARAVAVVGTALAVVTVVGFGLAALAAAGWIVPPGMWRPLVLGSAATSTVLLGLFFHPTLLVGFLIDAVLVWTVVVMNWHPGLDV
jgi:hypothetical protein